MKKSYSIAFVTRNYFPTIEVRMGGYCGSINNGNDVKYVVGIRR